MRAVAGLHGANRAHVPTAGSARPAGHRAQLGAVYTPSLLANWVAGLLERHAPGPITSVLDPACGDGALLRAVSDQVASVRRLIGIDLSAAAFADRASWPRRAESITADTLAISPGDLPEVDAVIMNPPWGAELTATAESLRSSGYTLAQGQCDSWDLFVEWAVRRLRPGTTVAMILPDALFLPGAHRRPAACSSATPTSGPSRDWARAGSTACSAVWPWSSSSCVPQAVTPRPAPPMRSAAFACPTTSAGGCLPASSTSRRRPNAVELRADQRDWLRDPLAGMAPARRRATTARSSGTSTRFGGAWGSWFSAGRGVEMGKGGQLLRCEQCGGHLPPPKTQRESCPLCGAATAWTAVEAVRFDRPRDSRSWVPLIVGEDVCRYAVRPSRWLRLGLPGLNYKPAETYRQPKLLVRKTGLGLQAAVDRSGSHTTQVVYHYLPTADAPAFALDYLQGVLCSRVLLAYHLKRSGETEWRSHPYVTPKVLATLPIPRPRPGTDQWAQAAAVADAAALVQRAPAADRPAAQLRVDRLVAGLFELDAERCDWVSRVIDATQALQAFDGLRDSGELRAELVA